MSPRTTLARGLIGLAAAAAALTGTPAALANTSTTNATWTGSAPVAGAANDPGYLWSNSGANGLNWTPATVPASPLNVLSFPDLAPCDIGAPATACYTSFDDLGALSVNQLSFGGSASAQHSYTIYAQQGAGSSVTLDGNGQTPNVGLVGAPPAGSSNLQLATFGVPIVLGADQQWNLSGNNPPYGGGLLYLDTIGGAHLLTLHLTDQATVQANAVNTGPVTVTGNGTLQLDYNAGSTPHLPAVSLTDPNSALVIATPGAKSGPVNLTSTGNQFYVLTNGIGGTGQAPTEATLAVTGGVTVNGGTTMEFDIDGNTTTAGSDASQLTAATGTVDFGNGAQISLWQAKKAGQCVALTPGNTYTLISAQALSGTISVGGSTVAKNGSGTETLQSNANECSTGPSTTQTKTRASVSYNSTTVTATILGLQAGSSAPTIGGKSTVGDTVKVTDNGSWHASPAPTYSYQWYACSGGTCAAISGATGASYTLTAAEVGKTIKVRVTAKNSEATDSAYSNSLGPVVAASGGGTSLRSLIRVALSRLGHPSGRRAILLMLHRGFYVTRFHAPVGGTLTDVWTSTIVSHGKRHSYVVARASLRVGAGRTARVTIRLTAAGRTLLQAHLLGLSTAARARFVVTGLGSVSLTRRFTL